MRVELPNRRKWASGAATLGPLLFVFLIVFSSPSHAQDASRASAGLQQAARALKAGDLTKAEDELQKILATNPRQPDALNMLGVVRGRQHRDAEAEAVFRRALEADSRFAGAYVNLGHLYRQQGQTARALENFRKAKEFLPRDPEVLFNLALLDADRKDFKTAIAELEAIPASQRPENYWEVLSRLYASEGDLTGAEASLRRILESRPDSVSTLRRLAGVALKRGNLQQAWNYLARARSLAPNSPELLYEFAQVSFENNLSREAVLAMRKAALLEPDNPEYLIFLGNSLLNTPDYHDALPYFQHYIQLKPEDAAGHLALGWALFLEKDWPGARKELQESLRLNPGQPAPYYHLGMIGYETGDNAQALVNFTRAVELQPNEAKAHFGLGLVYSRENRYEEARQEFETAVRLVPDEPKYHYQLSQAYARMGDTARARHEQELYLEAQKRSDEKIQQGQALPYSASEARRRGT